MGFLGALGAIGNVVGILGGINQAKQGGQLAARGMQDYGQAVTNSGNAYTAALKNYQDMQASGAYNAAQALKLLGDQASHALDLKDKNTAAQLSTLGYKRGDSPFTQQGRHNSEAANLQLRQDMLNTQRQYQLNQMNDMGVVNNYLRDYNNALSNSGQFYMQRGQQMQQSGMNSIGAGISSLGRANWDWIKAPTTDPFAQARTDMNPMHQYDRYGNLINGGS